MTRLLKLSLAAALLSVASACSSESDPSGTTDAGEKFTEAECALKNDSFGPGQYADACVKREWIAPYAGTFTSATCTLTVTTPSSGPAAVFTLVLTDPTLGGTYTIDWEGNTGAGNDSYYRFTTDATYATTKTLNFNAGQAVSATEERNIRLRVENLDTGTVTYTGGFGKTVSSPFSDQDVDCGAMTFAP